MRATLLISIIRGGSTGVTVGPLGVTYLTVGIRQGDDNSTMESLLHENGPTAAGRFPFAAGAQGGGAGVASAFAISGKPALSDSEAGSHTCRSTSSGEDAAGRGQPASEWERGQG